MGKINNIKFNYGRTVNLGNYESLRIDVELSSTVNETDNVESIFETLRQQAKLMVKKTISLDTNQKADDYEDFY